MEPASHVGHFYWDERDLLATLVPFFATGLRQQERCVWVCVPPLCAQDARSALADAVPDALDRERLGQLAIVDHDAWYRAHAQPALDEVIRRWLDAERDALADGYRGLRINASTFWLDPEHIYAALRNRSIRAAYCYPLTSALGALDIDRLVRLNRFSAVLAEVTTRLQLAAVVRDLVPRALDASSVVLLEVDARDGAALVADGPVAGVLRGAAAQAPAHAIWSSELALVPIRLGTRRLATLALGFAGERAFRAPDRALAEDVARQLALALDRALTYERLEHERARAESASRAKDEFLAMLGHELRNPLSPILTATQLMRLRDEALFEKERTVIERQTRHMVRLVDDLLDVSRITRGKIELRRRPLEISEVVAQAVELASPAMEQRAHRLTLDVASSGMIVHADPHRLAQVISNLLNNAAKYTPHGGAIHVAGHVVEGMVVITVRDSGIGMDPKLLPHVFDLFVQGRQGIDRAAGGLGLGLTIARTIVELHGGTIRARSAGQGKGSEITFELPRYANARPAPRANHSGAFALTVMRPFHVLVVDDNEDAAFLFSEALKKLGHEVDVAHDGPSALAVARQRPPEIAFLDIGLPVMDGYELGRRLKALGGTPPKIVAVTGYGHTSDRARSREAGFDLHLVKPIDFAQIQDALAKLGS